METMEQIDLDEKKIVPAQLYAVVFVKSIKRDVL